MRWYEAVAIAQGIYGALAEAHQESMLVDLDTVFIHADGRVFIDRAEVRDRETVVNSVGRILQEICGNDVPAALKIVISNAIAIPPHYPSIRELSRSLEYFERPNRAEVLQRVYDEWSVLPASVLVPAPIPVAAVEVAPPSRNKDAPADKRPGAALPLSPESLILPTAAAVLVLCGIVIWAIGRPSAGPAVPPSDVIAFSGMDRILPAEPPPSLEKSTPPVRARRPGEVTSQPRQRLASDRRVSAPAARKQQMPSASVPAAVGAVKAKEDEPRERVADPATYTSANLDVTAPVAIYSSLSLRKPTEPGVSPFELIITDTGSVESVRAVTAPNSVVQTMRMAGILSAIKSWRFRPASIHGRPVRYRLLVWLPLS